MSTTKPSQEILGCYNQYNSLSELDVPSIRDKFFLDDPDLDVKVFADTWASDPPNGYFAIYNAYYDSGLRFPLCPALLEILHHYQIALSQLSPGSIRYIIGFAIWCRLARKPWSLQLFRTFYMLKPSLGHYYYICKRSNKKIAIPDLVSPTFDAFAGWKNSYFFVKLPTDLGISRWNTENVKDPRSGALSRSDIRSIIKSKVTLPLRTYEDELLAIAQLNSAGPLSYVPLPVADLIHLNFLAGLLKSAADSDTPVTDLQGGEDSAYGGESTCHGGSTQTCTDPPNDPANLFTGLEEITGGKRSSSDIEILGSSQTLFHDPLLADLGNPAKKKQKRKAGKVTAENGSDSSPWDPLTLTEVYEKFITASGQISGRLKKACDDELALHNLATAMEFKAEGLAKENLNLRSQLRKAENDHIALEAEFTKLNSQVQVARDKQSNFEKAVNDAIQQQQKSTAEVERLQKALEDEKASKAAAVDQAIAKYKASSTFAKEYEIVMIPASYCFFHKGVTELLAANGEVSGLASKHLFKANQEAELDKRFAELASGVNIIEKYKKTSANPSS